MSLPWTIARRYLRPHRVSFIGLIGLVSVIGIVIGTAALIIVMSLFNGFRGIASDMMTSFGAHIRVQGACVTFPPSREYRQTPVWLSKLVIQSGGRTLAAYGVGVVPADNDALAPLQKATLVGSADIGMRNNIAGVVIAAGVSEKMNLYLGDTITLISPKQIESAISNMMLPSGARVIVRGIFQSNASREIDASYIYTSDMVMKGLLRKEEPTAWDIRLTDLRETENVATVLRAELGASASIQTYEDMNRGLFDTMRLERVGSFIVLALIILVAAFNILVSLTLGVVEKRRDIAILKTIGFTDGQVRNVYLYQGFMIGLISVVVGAGIGLLICWGQSTFHWIRFDISQGYLVPALPLDVQLYDVIAVVAVGLLLSCTAAIYPARRAARTIVSEGVRSE